MLSPLSKLVFLLNNKAETAFARLKELFVSDPVLCSPDIDRQFIVEVDTSNTGVGGVLSQHFSDGKIYPCAFVSRSLSSAECNYDIGE